MVESERRFHFSSVPDVRFRLVLKRTNPDLAAGFRISERQIERPRLRKKMSLRRASIGAVYPWMQTTLPQAWRPSVSLSWASFISRLLLFFGLWPFHAPDCMTSYRGIVDRLRTVDSATNSGHADSPFTSRHGRPICDMTTL